MRDLGGVVRYKKRIDRAVCLKNVVEVVRSSARPPSGISSARASSWGRCRLSWSESSLLHCTGAS